MRLIFSEIGRNIRRYWKLNCIAVMTICTLFSLCSAGLLVAYNVRTLLIKWSDRYSLHVYFKRDVEKEGILNVIDRIRQNPFVRKVQYVSPKRTLDQFLATFPGQADLLNTMEENPFPSSLDVMLVNRVYRPAELFRISDEIRNVSGIADVAYDVGWSGDFYRLFRFLSIAGVASGIIAFALTLLLVTSIYRLSFRERQRHASVMSMMGAGRGVFFFPLFMEGMLYGILGAAGAALLLKIVWGFFTLSGHSILSLIAPWLEPQFFSSSWVGLMIMAGGGVGLLSSLFAARELNAVGQR